MNRALVEFIAHLALFLENSDEDQIALETAVRLQEELAFRLRKLDPTERVEFARLLEDVGRNLDNEEDRQVLLRLPVEVGIA